MYEKLVMFNRRTLFLLMMTAVFSAGCAIPEKFQLAEPPEVSAATAATLKFRSMDNLSDIVHHHVIRIDGQPLSILTPDSSDSITLNAGTHDVQVTCHTRIENTNSPPHNFSVTDGKIRKSVELASGDEQCFKVSFSAMNCAGLTEAEPSYCE